MRLVLLAVWDDQTLIAVAPWYLSRIWADGNCLRALGAGDVCSEYTTILCEAGYEHRVGEALANWLTDEARASDNLLVWDLLELNGVAAADRTVGPLLDHLAKLGNDIYPQSGRSCWRIDLPDHWDDFVARLSKSHRKQVRRAARKLNNDTTVVRRATNLDELRLGFAILIDLHQRRWKSLGNRGCFAEPGFAPFHQEASERLFRDGCVDLVWLESEGRPLAAEYQLLGSDVVYAYQSGIDPDRLAVEPGRLAVIATIQKSIERGYRSYDFLRGDEPYKAHWRAQPRPMWEICVVPPRAGARFRHGLSSATDSLKGWIKGGLELAGLR
jgi:CelD/BcsL family acetyltransferase involved in cellulose biosynthesis